ncbi:hypothetical protein EPO33_04545 [Patescibacteria group bacterium]|nr:MAG: hypothetical protein EPO33_04545 [Patescibacteria group bacterium]
MKRLLKGSIVALALSVALPAFAADNTKPVVGAPSPDTAVVGAAVSIAASVNDADSGIANCSLYIEFLNVGAMNVSGGIASKTYVFAEPGVYTVFVFCRDVAGNFASGPNTSVLVSFASGGGGAVPLSVGAIAPTSATAGISLTLSASVSSALFSCTLVVEGTQRGAMTVSAGTASVSYTFENPGSYAVRAQCATVGGTIADGQSTVVLVAAQVAPSFGSRLIKLACPPNAAAFDSCRSVYYQGVDGKRHAFPSDKVYFSWYENFEGIQTVDGTALAGIPLGTNVTYRPGVKLVKFESVSKVYAVSRGGVLRWITSESAAREVYGSDWGTKVNDISDAFFGNYSFGADITGANDYSPAAETSATATIDANIR